MDKEKMWKKMVSCAIGLTWIWFRSPRSGSLVKRAWNKCFYYFSVCLQTFFPSDNLIVDINVSTSHLHLSFFNVYFFHFQVFVSWFTLNTFLFFSLQGIFWKLVSHSTNTFSAWTTSWCVCWGFKTIIGGCCQWYRYRRGGH